MIRPTVSEDKQFLLELFKEEGVLAGFPMKTEMEVEDSCNFWMEVAIKGYGLTYEVKGQIAGMIVIYVPIYHKLRRAALFSLVVGQSYRRQHIGTDLINALEKMGTQTYELNIIHLEVYEKNEAAIRLYEKLGYSAYGTQEKFIKEDGQYATKILMEKRFS